MRSSSAVSLEGGRRCGGTIEAMNKGILVISIAVPVTQTKIALVWSTPTFPGMGGVSGHYLVKYLKGKPAFAVVTFRGPREPDGLAGFNDGFKDAIKGSSVKFLAEKFGDTGA